MGCTVLLKVPVPCLQALKSSFVFPAPAGQHRPQMQCHVNPAGLAVPSAVLQLRTRYPR